MSTTILPTGAPVRARSKRRGYVVAVAAGAVVMSVGAFLAVRELGGHPATTGAPAHGPVPGLTASQLLQESNAAAGREGWVHVLATDAVGGRTETYQNVSGPSSGEQTVSYGSAHAEVRVVGTTTYVRGNASALEAFFGFPRTTASVMGARWLVLHPGDRGYPAVTDGVTLGSVLHELTLTGPLTRLAGTVRDGQRVVGVRGVSGSGTQAAPATLWIAAAGAPTPVEFDAVEGQVGLTVHFTAWGSPAKITVPTSSTPLSRLLTHRAA